MRPFRWECDWCGGSCASFALPRVCGGHAAVDVDDISCGLCGTRAGEEGDRLRDVLGQHGDTELRAALVEGLQLVLADAVRAGALGLPVGRPDRRALDHCIRVDGVYANAARSALFGEAAGEMERRR